MKKVINKLRRSIKKRLTSLGLSRETNVFSPDILMSLIEVEAVSHLTAVVIKNTNKNNVKFAKPLLKKIASLSKVGGKQDQDFKDYKIVFLLDLGWFGYNIEELSKLLFSQNIILIRLPNDVTFEHLNLSITAENGITYVHNSFKLIDLCSYEICVFLELDRIEQLDLRLSDHLEALKSIYLKTVNRINYFLPLSELLKPELIIYPQGYVPPTNVLRYISEKLGIEVLALENTCDANKMMFESETKITTTYNTILKKFRGGPPLDEPTYLKHWDQYFDNIKVNKQDEHKTPQKQLIINKSFDKIILFLGQVGTDSSLLFSSREIVSQAELILKIATNLIHKNVLFIVKLHPKEQRGSDPIYHRKYNFLTFRKLKKLPEYQLIQSSSNIIVDHTNKYDTYNLIHNSDLCITINSQAGLEAACLGKPVINCGDSFYSHEGFINQVRIEEDLSVILNNFNLLTINSKLAKAFFYHYTHNCSTEKSASGVAGLVINFMKTKKNS